MIKHVKRTNQESSNLLKKALNERVIGIQGKPWN